jgi:hypothetical protein
VNTIDAGLSGLALLNFIGITDDGYVVYTGSKGTALPVYAVNVAGGAPIEILKDSGAMGYEPTKAEAEKGVRSKNPDAIDLVMRGRAFYLRALKNPTKDNNNAARALFGQALKIDPNNSEALVGDAQTYWEEYMYGWGNSETDYDAKILGQVDRAISLAPVHIWAYAVKSYYLGVSRRFNEGGPRRRDGLAVAPSMPLCMQLRHPPRCPSGVSNKRNKHSKAMRLSPRNRVWSLQNSWAR